MLSMMMLMRVGGKLGNKASVVRLSHYSVLVGGWAKTGNLLTLQCLPPHHLESLTTWKKSHHLEKKKAQHLEKKKAQHLEI